MKYQVEYKKLAPRIGVLLLIGAVAYGAFFLWQKKTGEKDGGEPKVFDVAVIAKDQNSGNSEEDQKSSLKAGDVALAREAGRDWSDTEKRIYLILKMKLTEAQAARLTEPETIKLTETEAKEKGIFDDEMMKDISKEEKEEMLKQTVRARKYRIKVEELGMDLEEAVRIEPFLDKEFGWEIVEEKDKSKKGK